MNHNWLSGGAEQREIASSHVQSAYGLSTGSMSGMHTSCINTFVIWRSTQEELHRSSTLKLGKHMYLQRQIAASH